MCAIPKGEPNHLVEQLIELLHGPDREATCPTISLMRYGVVQPHISTVADVKKERAEFFSIARFFGSNDRIDLRAPVAAGTPRALIALAQPNPPSKCVDTDACPVW